MSASIAFVQSPREKIDYVFDFTEWLDGTRTINDASVSVEPDEDIVITNIQVADNTVTIEVSEGVANGKYRIKCRIVTDTGLAKESVIVINIIEN